MAATMCTGAATDVTSRIAKIGAAIVETDAILGLRLMVVGTKIELVDAAAAYELWRAGKLKKTEAARRCGMAWSSFWRYVEKRMEAEDE